MPDHEHDDSDDGSEWVELTSTEELPSARIIESVLRSADIEAFVRDMNMLAQAPHLGGGKGGYRVEVRQRDYTDAQAILASKPSVAEEEAKLLASSFEEEEGANSDFEPAAKRTLRLALFGFFLWPILHPVSLILGIRMLVRGKLTMRARRDIRMALVMSVFSLVVFGAVVTSIVRSLDRAKNAASPAKPVSVASP